jgi:hypothetical protein
MATYKPVVIKTGELQQLQSADDFVANSLQALASGRVAALNGIDTGSPFTTGYHDSFRMAADEQLHFHGHLNLATGVAIVTANDTDFALVPLELRSSFLAITGGGANIGGTTDPGDGNLLCKNLPVSRVLAAVGGIDAKAATDTNLYTVPTDKTLVITAVIIRCTAASAISAPASASVLTTSLIQLWPSRSLTGFTTAGGMYTFTPDNTWNIFIAAGNTVMFRVNTAATGTSQTFSVDLIGYLLQ